MYQCKCCNGSLVQELIDLGQQPFANKYPSEKQKKNEMIMNLSILICLNCFTAFTKTIAPRDIMFEEYFYLSSVNKELVNHFNELAKSIPSGSNLLDIGSNDGILLKPLMKRNVDALGIDPSENVGKIANDKGLKTIIGFFDEKNTNEIIKQHGRFDYVVASSIFTHVEDSEKFVENVKKVLRDDGTFILEIEYIKNLLSNIEFERFYFDRPYYFSIKGIMSLFEKVGMYVNKIEEISPHGGSLRFYIQNKKSIKNHYEKLLNDENIFFKNIFKSNFKEKVLREANNFKKFLTDNKNQGKKIVGFGCPARFSTITNFINIDQNLISLVIDDSPLKQKKFSPGMHIPIMKRETLLEIKPDIIIVFAYEYFESIYEFTKQFSAKHYKPIPLSLLERKYE